MLTLFNKLHKKGGKDLVESGNIIEIGENIKPKADEATLKKSIASKLESYRPVEREANFTGPKY